jgi:hypothetical protein
MWPRQTQEKEDNNGKLLLKPITFNEVSHNVVLLHKALDVLELPVSEKEVERKKAG